MNREELEQSIRARFDAGDLAAAATLAIEGYGREICGFLAAILRDEEAAREVFAETAAELWRDLPRFRWEASLRTWLYVVARHRLSAHRSKPARRREVLQSAPPELVAQVRTTTVPWQRTEVKDQVAQLRASLSPDEQALLILRIDRGMPWRDVAAIMGEASEPALRKRFERIKDRLRELVQAKKPE